jgi:hypothetical protein
MKLKTELELVTLLLTTIESPVESVPLMKERLADIVNPLPYRTEVFISPGGEYGDACMLFSSLINAAHFLATKSSIQWVFHPTGDSYAELTKHREVIRRRCRDDSYGDGWWFARDTQNADGSNHHIDHMDQYGIIDMRCYEYKKADK